MRKSRKWFFWIGGLVLLLGLIVNGILIAVLKTPSIDNQLAQTITTSVSIVSPSEAGNYPADADIPITALARSTEQIASLELWVDGDLYAAQPPAESADPQFLYQTWHWMPAVEGEHLVVVRAETTSGAIAVSNILRIQADPAAGYVLIHTVREGETWDALADSCNSTAEDIAAQNPDLDPAANPPAGSSVTIPCGPVFSSAATGEESSTPIIAAEPDTSPAPELSDFQFMAGSLLSPVEALSAAPELTVGPNDCNVQLLVTDRSTDEQGFEVWRSGTDGFEQIATLGKNPGSAFSYEDTPGQSGLVQYIVSAINAQGKSPSNIAAITLPDHCAAAGNPLVSFAYGVLFLPVETDIAYLYASLDGGPWTRVPSGDGFLAPQNGEVDLTDYLQPLSAAFPAARQARVYVWGWSDGALQNLGLLTVPLDRATLTFCNLDDPTSCVGDVGSTHWVTDGEVPSNALNMSRTFRFRSNAEDAPYALVQIATRPFPQEFQLDNPYVVDSYLVPTEAGEGYANVDFTVNFSFYQQAEPALQAGTVDTLLDSTFGQETLNFMEQSGVGWIDLGVPQDPVYYVRVIPWYYSEPAGKPSNSVSLVYKPRVEMPEFNMESGSTPSYDLQISGFSPEQRVTPDLFGCVIITAMDEAVVRNNLGFITEMMRESQIAAYKAHLASGDMLCPPKIPQQTTTEAVLETIGEGMTDLWNQVVSFYNSIKNSVVTVLADGLNFIFGPGCCEAGCKSDLMTGLNMAITYFTGIPPNLPTAQQLLENGLDYAASLAMSEAGIPCDAECAGQIRERIQTVVESMMASSTQPGCSSTAAHFYGKQALCLPEGLTVQPVLGAQYIPGIVTITSTRTNPGYQLDLAGNDYSVLITSTVQNEAVVGQSFWFYGPTWGKTPDQIVMDGTTAKVIPGSPGGNLTFYYTIPEAMQGILFKDASIILPDTANTGAELTLPVALTAADQPPAQNPFIYQPLLNEALNQAQTMGMPASLQENLPAQLARYSHNYLGQPGFTITFTAQLYCYDRVAQGRVACSDPVTRTFTAEEIESMRSQMAGGQP